MSQQPRVKFVDLTRWHAPIAAELEAAALLEKLLAILRARGDSFAMRWYAAGAVRGDRLLPEDTRRPL